MQLIQQLWGKIKPHYIWYALVLVAILYFASYALDYNHIQYWPGVFSQAAATIIAGGIFASLLKSYQYSELFKGELEQLFADEKFVGRMKQIAHHGQDGKQTLRNTFEHLATQSSAHLGSRVRSSFPSLLAVSTEYTFRNYKRYIKITAYSRTKGLITIEDEVQYEVVVHNDADYKSSAGGAALTSSPKFKEFTLTEIGNDGAVVDLSKLMTLVNGKMEVAVPVKQGRAYRLQRSLEITYQLFKDPNIHLQFSRFSDGFELEIDNQVASDVQLTTTWINFEKPPVEGTRNDGGRTVCRFTEHGLTFPFQGFILTMCPNK